MRLDIGIIGKTPRETLVFLDRGILKRSLWCKYCEKSLVSLSSHHFVLKAVVITQKCMAAAREIKTFKEILPF